MSEKPHKRLALWQRSVEFVVSVYAETKSFPAAEKFGLAAQMRRAAVSIPSNVAEGSARRTRREYQQFLFIARGSIGELDTQIEIAGRLGYLKPEAVARLCVQLDAIGRMLTGLLKYVGRADAS
jgi:four helix bundle protein